MGARNRYYLSFWRFFPQFYSIFWPNLGAIHVARPVAVLWRFPLFCRHFRWLWGLGAQIHHLSFSGPNMASRENGQFWSEKYYKTAEKTPKGQIVPSSRAHRGTPKATFQSLLSYFKIFRVLGVREGTHFHKGRPLSGDCRDPLSERPLS